MIVYRGSNVEVKHPQIMDSLRALDFGAGFYTTSKLEQAMKWARAVAKRRRTGLPCVNVYDLNESKMGGLRVLRFDSPSEKWLDFVVLNRKDLPWANSWDIVIGPVANDATLPVIDDYMDGKYTKDEAIRRLLPQKLSDQYACLTENAISLLEFRKCEVLS